ncbi:hypothetical protein MFIFM68171_08237 [Madurella fahalii]|uniref:Uncharacterized protein n=1 Tax=Madurella fahalii TaxID=1157608 RepID=A0ABQ0GJW9_9PEZI
MGAENENMSGANCPSACVTQGGSGSGSGGSGGGGGGGGGGGQHQVPTQLYFPYQQPPPYLDSIPGIDTSKTPLNLISEPAYYNPAPMVQSTATLHELNLAKECSDLHDKMTASTDAAGTMHIAKADLDRFLELFRQLSIPKRFHYQFRQPPGLGNGPEDGITASQASDLFHQGYRAAYANAFELGRRSAGSVAYKMHAGALAALGDRVSDLRLALDLGGLPPRAAAAVTAELAELDAAVQGLLAQARVAAATEGLSFDDMFQMAVNGKYAEYLGLAGADPTVEGWDSSAAAIVASEVATRLDADGTGQGGGGDMMEGGWQTGMDTGI